MGLTRGVASRAKAILVEPVRATASALAYAVWAAGRGVATAEPVGEPPRGAMEGRFPLERAEREQVVAALRLLAPDIPAQVVAEAERIRRHEVDLLGSGPVALGAHIDWHSDFRSRHRWPQRRYFRWIRPAPYPGGYDIKVPWELSRCHHLVRLGQACWLTGHEAYAREFVAQVEDWVAANPRPWGVNWACAMEAAIRAVNWLWAFHLVRGAQAPDDAFARRLCASLLGHGRHILQNLERQGDFANNHYLADLVGLLHLGMLCPWADEAASWRDLALRELWAAVEKQVWLDGVYFEASTAYHRLATEMLLSAVALCQHNGVAVPEPVMDRLERMLEFILWCTRPDGTAPAIGDGDNGRLLRLAVWADAAREWTDHRYLLAIGAVLLGRDDLARAAGDQWQEALWLLGTPATHVATARSVQSAGLSLPSRAFRDGGFYILRSRDLHMIVHAGPNGQNGYGGHAHNDTLSFELYAGGRSWIVDPGTYVYTADYHARDRFRGTVSHNVVQVDGHEINRLRPGPFGLYEDARPRVYEWRTAARYDLLDAGHSGYARLREPVLCRRQVYLDREAGYWAIRDVLTGRGSHRLTLRLHLAAVRISAESARVPAGVRLEDGHEALDVFFLAPEGAGVALERGEISPSYGVKRCAPVVSVSVSSSLPVEFLMVLAPLQAGDARLSRDVAQAMAAAAPWPEVKD
ncbi:MAG: heparinase II/III family protein [Anaerolineae bacterium]|nr:heparinase II/III family protein [Anaerolineae bacterium]